MPDAALTYRSALAAVASPDRIGPAVPRCGVSLRIVDNVAAVSVMARKGRSVEVAARIGEIVGTPVEDRAGRWAAGTLAAVGVGPGQWLVTHTDRDLGRLVQLRDHLTGLAALTEQGDGRIVIEVAGNDARRTLSKGIQVDLHPAAFPVGAAASCSASHIPLVLCLLDARPTFQIISAASTAESLWSWLSVSSAEYAAEVVR